MNAGNHKLYAVENGSDFDTFAYHIRKKGEGIDRNGIIELWNNAVDAEVCSRSLKFLGGMVAGIGSVVGSMASSKLAAGTLLALGGPTVITALAVTAFFAGVGYGAYNYLKGEAAEKATISTAEQKNGNIEKDNTAVLNRAIRRGPDAVPSYFVQFAKQFAPSNG